MTTINNINKYGSEFSNGWQAAIPAGETVKVGFRMADDSIEYLELPVTQDILDYVGGTINGSFYCVNLSYLGIRLKEQGNRLYFQSKSYFLPNTK